MFSKNLPSGLKIWGLKSILRNRNPRLYFCRGIHKTFVQSAWRVSHSSVQHLREHKKQTNTEIKQRWRRDSKKQLKCWSKRKPTVGLRWARPEPEHQEPTDLLKKYLGRSRYWVWGSTRRRATKEGSKVINHDWVNYHNVVCHITFMLYQMFIYQRMALQNWVLKSLQAHICFLNSYTKSP